MKYDMFCMITENVAPTQINKIDSKKWIFSILNLESWIIYKFHVLLVHDKHSSLKKIKKDQAYL